MEPNRLKARPVAYLFLLSRLLLGAVFLAAGAGKLFHPGEFAGIIRNYQILPDMLVNGAAIVLPWLEMLVGVLILCGWWLPGSVSIANLLLIVFLIALGSAAARGIDIDCGCFSVSPASSSNFAWYLSRDLFFLFLGAATAVRTFKIGSVSKDLSS